MVRHRPHDRQFEPGLSDAAEAQNTPARPTSTPAPSIMPRKQCPSHLLFQRAEPKGATGSTLRTPLAGARHHGRAIQIGCTHNLAPIPPHAFCVAAHSRRPCSTALPLPLLPVPSSPRKVRQAAISCELALPTLRACCCSAAVHRHPSLVAPLLPCLLPPPDQRKVNAVLRPVLPPARPLPVRAPHVQPRASNTDVVARAAAER